METHSIRRPLLGFALALSAFAALAQTPQPAPAAAVPQPTSTCQLSDGTDGGATTNGSNNIACGRNAFAGIDSLAFGPNAVAGDNHSIAIGPDAVAGASDSTVIGSGSQSLTSNTTIIGARSSAIGQATLIGNDITASSTSIVGVGRGLTLAGQNSVGVGNAVRIGSNATNGVGLGSLASVSEVNGTALGAQSHVDGTNGTAAGATSRVLVGTDAAAAFGYASIGDRSNAVSFGNASLLRQLIYVAAGSEDTDAVNVSQLKQVMEAFGGGANFNGGIFGAPTFTFASGDVFNNVNDALMYLDGRITRISLTPGPQGPTGPQGPQGPAGPGTGGTDCAVAVCYDDSTRQTATLNSGGQSTRLQNVAAGVNSTDAVNLGQMQAADIDILNQANDYTDARVSNMMQVLDDRFDVVEARLDRMGAMNSAMAMMTSSAAAVREQNRMAVGVGFSGAEKAIAAGYQRLFDNGAVATFGVSYAGGDTTAGFGFGFGF